MAADIENFVLVGRVAGAHALKGEVKIRLYSGDPGSFLQYARILLAVDSDEVPAPYKVERARAAKDCVLVKLERCSTRSEAELLVHASVYVREEDLPEPGPNEFYLRDLEGRQMKTDDGRIIGRIAGLLLGSGQELALVEDNGREYLVPLIPEFIVAVEEDVVTVSLPPGLLDINA